MIKTHDKALKPALAFLAATTALLGGMLAMSTQALAAPADQPSLGLMAQTASNDEATNQESTDQDGGSTDQGSTDTDDGKANDDVTVTKVSSKIIMLKGETQNAKFSSDYGTLTAKTSNKGIVKVTRTGKSKFKIKARKNGTTTVTFSSKTFIGKYKIVVASGNSYVSKWTKNIASQIKASNKNVKDRLLMASSFIISNFSYANKNYDAKTTIMKRKGTCYSAGVLLVKIYKAMGYKATLRYAVNDNMSRYPSNITFGSQHYNVKVVVKGKTYYLDATPGMGFVYLSNSKKPLAEYMYLGGSWIKVM